MGNVVSNNHRVKPQAYNECETLYENRIKVLDESYKAPLQPSGRRSNRIDPQVLNSISTLDPNPLSALSGHRPYHQDRLSPIESPLSNKNLMINKSASSNIREPSASHRERRGSYNISTTGATSTTLSSLTSSNGSCPVAGAAVAHASFDKDRMIETMTNLSDRASHHGRKFSKNRHSGLLVG